MEESFIIESVKKCQKEANPKAFKVLYDAFAGQVYATCLRYLNDEMEAQDIVQETFITAYFKIGNYHFKGPFGAWITRIAVNNCLQKLRGDKNKMLFRDLNEPGIDMTESTADVLNETEKNELATQLIGMLNTLPLGYKTILNLVVIEGYSHKEVAESLGISETTSRSQLTRAKEAFRKRVADNNLTLRAYE